MLSAFELAHDGPLQQIRSGIFESYEEGKGRKGADAGDVIVCAALPSSPAVTVPRVARALRIDAEWSSVKNSKTLDTT